MLALAGKFCVILTGLVCVCFETSPAKALEGVPISPALAKMLYYLHPVQPKAPDWPMIGALNENPTDSEVQVWSTNEKSECDSENFDDGCRGHMFYFVLSESFLGGRRFGFKTGPAFHLTLRSFEQIPAESNSGRSCVLFTLEERVKVNPKKPRWEEQITHICATPRGFVKYRPPAGTKP